MNGPADLRVTTTWRQLGRHHAVMAGRLERRAARVRFDPQRRKAMLNAALRERQMAAIFRHLSNHEGRS